MCTMGVDLLSSGNRDRKRLTMKASALRTASSYLSRSMPGLKSTAEDKTVQQRRGKLARVPVQWALTRILCLKDVAQEAAPLKV